jgi:hypothetical protein
MMRSIEIIVIWLSIWIFAAVPTGLIAHNFPKAQRSAFYIAYLWLGVSFGVIWIGYYVWERWLR